MQNFHTHIRKLRSYLPYLYFITIWVLFPVVKKHFQYFFLEMCECVIITYNSIISTKNEAIKDRGDRLHVYCTAP